MSKHLSDDRNNAGLKGEHAAQNWLAQLYGAHRVIVADKKLQDVNVDFVVLPSGEETLYIEVKTDRVVERTGNFAFELGRIKHNRPLNQFFYPSWFIASQANALVVYGPVNRLIYVMGMANARRVANEYIREHREKTNWRAVFTDFERTSINLLMPINEVPHDLWQYNADARCWKMEKAA